jgi:hypothetical protein
MIILRDKHNLNESKRPKNWFDYIIEHLNSDTAFDILYDIFDGTPFAKGPLLSDAVLRLKKHLPSVPNNEIARYVKVWVEHHTEFLNTGYR